MSFSLKNKYVQIYSPDKTPPVAGPSSSASKFLTFVLQRINCENFRRFWLIFKDQIYKLICDSLPIIIMFSLSLFLPFFFLSQLTSAVQFRIDIFLLPFLWQFSSLFQYCFLSMFMWMTIMSYDIFKQIRVSICGCCHSCLDTTQYCLEGCYTIRM